MAFYRPWSNRWKELSYNQDLWNGEGGIFPLMVRDVFPPITEMTLGESQEAAWLYGVLYVTGKGSCRVFYPYTSEPIQDKPHRFKSVGLHEFPFVCVEALGDNFLGWYSDDVLLEDDPILEITLSNKLLEDVIELEARFKQ